MKAVEFIIKVSVRDDAPDNVWLGIKAEMEPVMQAFIAEMNPGFEGLIETEFYEREVPQEVVSPWIPKSELMEDRVYPVKGTGLLLAIWRNGQFVGRVYDDGLGRYILKAEKHFDDGGKCQAYYNTALTQVYSVDPDTPPGTILHELEEIEQETGVRVF